MFEFVGHNISRSGRPNGLEIQVTFSLKSRNWCSLE